MALLLLEYIQFTKAWLKPFLNFGEPEIKIGVQKPGKAHSKQQAGDGAQPPV